MKRLCERCLFSHKSSGDSPHLSVLQTSITAPLMDVSVWQVLIYLAPTAAHSDEAVRAECFQECRGTLYFTLSQNNRPFPARCRPERLIRGCQGWRRKGGAA